MSGFNWLLPLIPQPEVPKAAAGGSGASSQPKDVTTTIPAGTVANADGSHTIATINGVKVNVLRDGVVDTLGAAARTEPGFKWTIEQFKQARSDYADRLAEYGEKLNTYSEQQVDYPAGGTPKPSPSPTPSPSPAPVPGSATP